MFKTAIIIGQWSPKYLATTAMAGKSLAITSGMQDQHLHKLRNYYEPQNFPLDNIGLCEIMWEQYLPLIELSRVLCLKQGQDMEGGAPGTNSRSRRVGDTEERHLGTLRLPQS